MEVWLLRYPKYLFGDLSLVGNGMGNPVGIAPVTHTHTQAVKYLQPTGFPVKKKFKKVQIGPELKEIQPILINFVKSAGTPSVLLQKLCLWTCFKAHR